MAVPAVFTNVTKATALANAIAGSPFPSAGSWFLEGQWGAGESSSPITAAAQNGLPAGGGERWKTAFFGARIDLQYFPVPALWQATLWTP
jgi:hypothetical protein